VILSLWFIACMVGVVAVLPLYFRSLEHGKLEHRYGAARGVRLGERLGLVSGWGFFLCWIGLWIAPQPRFVLPVWPDLPVPVLVDAIAVPLSHLVLGGLCVVPGGYLGIKGTLETTVRVAETHRAVRVVTTGVYSVIRHPQYVGGLLAHVGIALLGSAWYALLSTPFMALVVYVIAKKEERELVHEFGEAYVAYASGVPGFVPTRSAPRDDAAQGYPVDRRVGAERGGSKDISFTSGHYTLSDARC
jgi:protein-S-isoprenylcysteine O-methyltransferase Ste14